MKRKEIIEKHKEKYSVWFASDNYWKTRLPDGSPKGRLIKRRNEQDLYNAIIAFYKVPEKRTDIITIRKLYPEFLAQKKLEKIADTTYVRYQNTWNKYLESDTELIDADITKLKKGFCKTWTLKFLDKNPMKRKCYSGIKSLITQILEVATDRDYVIGNIYRDIHVPTNCFVEDVKPDEEQVFTDKEIELLSDYLWARYGADTTYTAPLAILFVFETGLRVAELEAMKFSDIDEDNFIQIKRQRVKKLNANGELKNYAFVEHAKSHSRKQPLYIPTEGQKILSIVKEANKINGDGADGFIFYNQHKHMTTAVLDRLIETACRNTGIPIRRMHCIRKTYGSKLSDNGMPLQMVADAMGHASIETTIRHYIKNRNCKNEQAAMIESVFAKQGNQGNPAAR